MNIALFIDIDNARISLSVFKEILEQLRQRGKLAYVKIFGFNERKHMKYGTIIEENGFETAPTMRFKKRAKSQLDSRIFIDALRLFYTAKHIDEYCFITGEGDLVPLLSFLRAGGKSLITIASDTPDGNDHMYDAKLNLGISYKRPNKMSKSALNKKFETISKRSQEIMNSEDDDDEANKKQRAELIEEIKDLLRQKPEDLDDEEEEMFDSLESLIDILSI